MITTELAAAIYSNKVEVTHFSKGKIAVIEAPFSCSHLIVSDFDILEETLRQAFMAVGMRALFSFARVRISVLGRECHVIERRAIRDAAMNAGASQVEFNHGHQCAEGRSEREAYVTAINRRR